MNYHCIFICFFLLVFCGAQDSPEMTSPSGLSIDDYPQLVKDAWENNTELLPQLYREWGNCFHERGEKEEALRAWLSILDIYENTWSLSKDLAEYIHLRGYSEEAVEILLTSALYHKLEKEEYLAGAKISLAWKEYSSAEKFLLAILQQHWLEEEDIIPSATNLLCDVYEKQIKWEQSQGNEEETKTLSQKLVLLRKGIRPMDVKIILTWDTQTDIDLWVTNPQLKRCFYSNRITRSGEKLHNDNTTGLGPETFTILKAQPGRYKIQVNYFSGESIPTQVQVKILFHVGTEKEKTQVFSAQLEKNGDIADIIDLYFPKDLK